MKKVKSGSALKDIMDIFYLRLKLIIKDITTLAALISSILIFSVVIHALSASAEERSSLPVGFVDYDDSKESRALIDRLAKVPTLRIIEDSEEELHKLLLDEMVNAVFVIDKGYEKKLKKANPEEVISVYYVDSNKSASIISDIVAGEMIYPISLYKSILLYERLKYEGEKLTAAEYSDYVDKLLVGSTDFDFAFRMIYENPDKAVVEEAPLSNAILYNQVIFGILGILVSFIAMFLLSGVVRDKELGVEERLKISKFQSLKLDTGSFCTILLLEGIIALIFSALIYRQLGVSDIRLYISSCLLILSYSLMLGGLFLLVAKAAKSIIVYQMFCTLLILITGGLGFYRMLTGLSGAVSLNFLKIIPNSWFIQGFTDIIVYGNQEGILTQGHRILLLQAAVVVLLILASDLIRGKTGLSSIKRNDDNRMDD
jgi:hypothetical protein